jgi:hypothetical protein
VLSQGNQGGVIQRRGIGCGQKKLLNKIVIIDIIIVAANDMNGMLSTAYFTSHFI